MGAPTQSFKGQEIQVSGTVNATGSLSSVTCSCFNVSTTEPDIRHAVAVRVYPAAVGIAQNASNWLYRYASGAMNNVAVWEMPTGSGTGALNFPLTGLNHNDRIRSVKAHVHDGNTALNTISMLVYRIDPTVNAKTQIGTTQTSSPNVAVQQLTVSGLTETVTLLTSPQRCYTYWVEFTVTGTLSNKDVIQVEVEVDKVA